MGTIARSSKNTDWVDDMIGAAARISYAGTIHGFDKIIAARLHFEDRARRTLRDAKPRAQENGLWRSTARMRELERALDRWDNEGGANPNDRAVPGTRHSSPAPAGVPLYLNDIGVREIRIGATQFHCIGALPPHDHPHIYLNMEGKAAILCPYCSTNYRFDSFLPMDETEPAGCFYAPRTEGIAVPAEGREIMIFEQFLRQVCRTHNQPSRSSSSQSPDRASASAGGILQTGLSTTCHPIPIHIFERDGSDSF